MFFKVNDQRSTTDQLADLAVLVADNELPNEAEWLRTCGKKGVVPSPENRQVCIKIANQHGFYDAADWVKSFESSNE